jgi:virginiamycin A acetyltransferase
VAGGIRKILGRMAGRRAAPPRTDVLVEQRVELSHCTLIGPIEIGFASYANESLIRNASIGRFCSIGRRCSIGAARHDVSAFSTHPDFAPPGFESGPRTRLGNDVWVGDLAIIVAGITIGDGACIGGGAVVTRDVPPYAIVGGVPAKLIRERFTADIAAALLQSEWWRYAPSLPAEVLGLAQPERFLAALSSAERREMPPHHAPWRNQG